VSILSRARGDPVVCRKGFDERMAGNYSVALEYLMKAAKMGDVEAHMQLGYTYIGWWQHKKPGDFFDFRHLQSLLTLQT
jgi:TPR repeat protein